jgi:S-formylglutathione hydrolase FrmB
MPRSGLVALGFVVLTVLASPTRGQSPHAETITYESPSVGRATRCRVILPASYATSSRRYPVLYLLHGFSGDFTSWSKHGVEGAAAAHEMIVALPDGGNSWYVNWSDAKGRKEAWEDAMVKDLVGHIDTHYRTIAGREGRAINGLSMGGYGALAVGLRHPDLFCAVGSSSGAVEYARSLGKRLAADPNAVVPDRNPSEKVNPAIGLEDFDSQEERTPVGRIFKTVEECAAHDPFTLVTRTPRDRLPFLMIDCGTEDPFLAANQEFADLLQTNKIAFVYIQTPGEHRSAYWRRAVAAALETHARIFRERASLPAR